MDSLPHENWLPHCVVRDTSQPPFQLWDALLKTMTPPPLEKCVFGQASHVPSLTLVIVEPRQHDWLPGVLYNAAHVYGNTGVGLYIIHSRANHEYVMSIIKGWKGIDLGLLPVDNLTIDDYNHLLTQADFWWDIPTEFALVFQTDTLLSRPIDAHFFQYDYVGAPWPEHIQQHDTQGRAVGNGGLSLRRCSTMAAIAQEDGPVTAHEDIFYATRLDPCRVPSYEEAKAFAVEYVYHPSPCGFHQPYFFHYMHDMVAWVKSVPGSSLVFVEEEEKKEEEVVVVEESVKEEPSMIVLCNTEIMGDFVPRLV